MPNVYEDDDNDKIVNAYDSDINGNNILNAQDPATNSDSDHDGIPDVVDADSNLADQNKDGYSDDDKNHDDFHDGKSGDR